MSINHFFCFCFEETGELNGSNQGPSVDQPSAFPLGHTGKDLARQGICNNRDWKDSMAVSVGRLFQSTIVRGKNENLRLSTLQYGTG